MMDEEEILRANAFATGAHYGVGQVRKYTGEPYINHPIAVALMVMSTEGCTTEMAVAALLHDTVEDTEVTSEVIEELFGTTVAEYVGYLTETSKEDFPELNRKARKERDAARLAAAPPGVQTIKYADFIDNTSSIVERDPEFAKTYLAEKAMMLEVIDSGDPDLRELAMEITRQ